jgi:hypothetical protein
LQLARAIPATAKVPLKSLSQPQSDETDTDEFQSAGSSLDEQVRRVTPRAVPSPKKCKAASDCSCPKPAELNVARYTSCIVGVCSCDNPFVHPADNSTAKADAAIGNSPIGQMGGQALQNVLGASILNALFGQGKADK